MPDPRFDVFLSHNSKDKPAVERIAEQLRQHRLEPWLDIWHLPVGQSFQDGIERGLKTARGCAYFVGAHGPGAWQRAELEAAQDLAVKDPNYQLFTVLLPGAPDPFDPASLPIFLAARTWVDLRGGFTDPARFQRLLNAVMGIPMGAPPRVEVEDGVAPYRGLQVFEEEHANFFFGRDNETQRLVEKLKGTRFLAIIGPSGSGKSSLVRAGLLPALKNGVLPGSHDWPVRILTPGARPLDALAAALALADPSRGMGQTLDELRTRVQALDQAATMLLAGRPATARLVLVIDQFEEIFTLCTDEEQRAKFLDALLYAATVQDGQCIIIFTLRADFYPRVAAYPSLATLLASHQALLGPLDNEGLRAVIEEPARQMGVSFEPGLVETILEDVGTEPGALPLLEHALLELWERRRGNTLHLAAYQESGGVGGALAQRADTIFTALTAQEQAVARRVLLRLTQPGEETEDTRRRAAMAELVTRPGEQQAVEHVVDKLATARLLTAGQPGPDGAAQVDVAHEALIRAWPRLRSWLDEDREGLRVHRRLTEAAQEWDEHQRDPDLLYRGARLAEAQALAARAPDLLNVQEAAFLAESVADRERDLALEADRRAAQERLRKRIFAGLAAFSLIALLLAGLAGLQWRNADAESTRANNQAATAEIARGDAETARSTAEAETDRADGEAAAALAARATAEAQGQVAEFERNNAVASEQTAVAEATRAAVAQGEAEAQALIANTERANAEEQAQIALSRQLAAQARTARRPDLGLLLSLESLRHDPGSVEALGSLASELVSRPGLVTVLSGHDDQVSRVMFSPNGEQLLSSSYDGTLVLWDTATGQPVGDPWQGPQDQIVTAEFSPDGTRVITASGEDGMLVLWDVATGTLVGDPWRMDEGGAYNVAFSHDGSRLAVTAANGTIQVWDVATASPSGDPLSGHTGQVAAAAFSPDGTRLVSTGQDMTVRLWDVAAGAQIGDPLFGTQSFQDVEFSPDGTRVITSADDGIVRVWDVSTRALVYVSPPDHEGSVPGIALAPDGVTVASAGVDGTVRLWDTVRRTPVGEPLQGHEGVVWSVAFSPDGTRLASGGADGNVVLWDMAQTPAIAKPWPVQATVVFRVAYSPDGALLVSGGGDGRIAIRDTTPGGQPTVTWVTNGSAVQSIAISPDGQVLASGVVTGEIKLWNVSGQPLPSMFGHTMDVISVTFSPDGDRLLSASADGTVRLWDVASGDQVAEPWDVSSSGVAAAIFRPDGEQVATASTDGMVQLWDPETGKPVGDAWRADDTTVRDLAFAPDGKLLATVGEAGTLRLWDPATGEPVGEPMTADGIALTAIAFSPDGTRIAGAGDAQGAVAVWDVATGELRHVHRVEAGGLVWDVSWHPDGERFASAGHDGTVRVWEAGSLDQLSTWTQTTFLPGLAFSPTNRHAASAGLDGTIVLWDATTGEPIGTPWITIRGSVGTLAFTPDGRRLAAGGSDGKTMLWDAAQGMPLGLTWATHEWSVTGLAFNADGSQMLSLGGDGTVATWDLTTLTQVGTMSQVGDLWRVHDDEGYIMALSPDGTVLATAGRDGTERTVKLWNLATKELIGEPLRGHNGTITGLAFNHDGSWLISGSADGTLMKWDVATSQLAAPPWRGHYGSIEGLALSSDDAYVITATTAGLVLWDVVAGTAIGDPWPGHDGFTLRVAFSPDGQHAISTGPNGDVIFWEITLEDWQATACRIANRDLTEAEWQQYLGNEPYHATCSGLDDGPEATPEGTLARAYDQ